MDKIKGSSRVLLQLLLAGLALSMPAFAQNPSPRAVLENTYSVDVSFEQNNSFIDDVRLDEIGLKNPERNRIVEVTRIGELPLRMVFLLDISGSQRASANYAGQFYANIIHSSHFRDMDSACLIAFNQNVRVLQDFTSDKDRLLRGLASTGPASGGSALLDAMYYASTALGNSESTRKVIVVLTDGEDRDSKLKLKDVYSQAIANHVRIYMFWASPGSSSRGILSASNGSEGLKHKNSVVSTGGKFIPASRLDVDLEHAGKMMEELNHLQRITITSSEKNPRDFGISVKRNGVKAYYPSALK